MYLKFFSWEIFCSRFSPHSQVFLDWYFSDEENHIWIGGTHIEWNRCVT